MPDVHFALSSRQNEVDYLRELADHVIGLIMDESSIAGHSSDSDSPSRNILTNHSVLFPSNWDFFIMFCIDYFWVIMLLEKRFCNREPSVM